MFPSSPSMLVRIFPLLELGSVLSKDEVEAYDSKQEYLQIQRMEVTLSVLKLFNL